MIVYMREVEKKFVVHPYYTYEQLEDIILSRFTVTSILPVQESMDTFWEAPHVDFVRLRENSKELTIKVTDRSTVTDRIEENVVVDDTRTAERLATLAFGPPTARLTKKFSVFEVVCVPAPGTEIKATVCLYKVLEDKKDRTFLEIEGKSIPQVDLVLERINFHVIMKSESRSLYQIFKEEGTK